MFIDHISRGGVREPYWRPTIITDKWDGILDFLAAFQSDRIFSDTFFYCMNMFKKY